MGRSLRRRVSILLFREFATVFRVRCRAVAVADVLPGCNSRGCPTRCWATPHDEALLRTDLCAGLPAPNVAADARRRGRPNVARAKLRLTWWRRFRKKRGSGNSRGTRFSPEGREPRYFLRIKRRFMIGSHSRQKLPRAANLAAASFLSKALRFLGRDAFLLRC